MNNNIKETTSLVFVKGNNLYDENTMLELVGAYRAGNSGNIITSATNKGLKLQAEPNSVYTITQTGASDYHEIAFFDKSFRYLSGTAITSTQITTPANCYIMTIQTNINATNIMINKGSTALPYEPYVENQIHTKNKNGVFEEFYKEDKINKTNYSTTEQLIGTWIDGKPLYRKTIQVTNQSFVAGNNNIPHNIDNLKLCVKVEAVKNGTLILPYMNLTSDNKINTATFVTGVDSTNIILRIANDSWGTSNTWYFTLYYTKTTD